MCIRDRRFRSNKVVIHRYVSSKFTPIPSRIALRGLSSLVSRESSLIASCKNVSRFVDQMKGGISFHNSKSYLSLVICSLDPRFLETVLNCLWFDVIPCSRDPGHCIQHISVRRGFVHEIEVDLYRTRSVLLFNHFHFSLVQWLEFTHNIWKQELKKDVL